MKTDLPSLVLEEDDFLREYSRVVRRVIRPYFLKGGDYDDLYQEGMIGLLKAIRTYDKSKTISFVAYAVPCIRNKVIDAVRVDNKTVPLTDNEVEFEITMKQVSVTDRSSNPETVVLENESAKEIKAVLSGLLSPFEASVLDSYLEGFTASEIGTTFGRTPKSVDNAIGRIRRKLAQHFLKGDSRTSLFA